jgi:Dolichyl-phosphate-mannose-protein mannosyltransferase
MVIAWRNVGFICVAFVLVYCVVHAFDPPRLNWGDSGSDYNVMIAGRNFQRYGFLTLRLTPHLLDPAVMGSSTASRVYTHYPQLPDVMNGVYRTVFHLSELSQFRLVALCFSFLALFFIYSLVDRYWGRQTAQISLALWIVNPLWIQHADHLHAVPYGAFFGYGSAYFLARYLAEDRHRWLLAASGVFLFFVFLSSYDYWPFAPALLVLVALERHRRPTWPAVRVLSVLAMFAVAAVLAKFATNAWALGGLEAFANDLRFQFFERTRNPTMGIHLGQGVGVTLIGRVERFYTLLLFPMIVVWLARPFAVRRWPALTRLAPGAVNPLWLLAAGLPFLCLFVELWVGQYYPALLLMPFYAVSSALLILAASSVPQRWGVLVAGVLFGALAINSLAENVAFKKTTFSWESIRLLRAELDTAAEPGQYLLTNNVSDFLYSYYFNHPTVDLVLDPPTSFDTAIAYYSDPRRNRVAPVRGALFIQHKHLPDELFDKGFYVILARAGLWKEWANPERYHSALDAFVNERDSLLVAAAARRGHKVLDTDDFAVWRLLPSAAPLESAGPSAPTR